MHMKLPSKGYMHVATFIASKYKGINATVAWYERLPDGSLQEIASVQMTSNCIHIQSFCVNSLFVH